MVRDLGAAEELAHNVLVAALEQWPASRIPQNPGAWLTAAKHRAIDLLRRNQLAQRKHEELGRETEAKQAAAVAELQQAMDDDFGDDLLRLIFMACHPVLSTEARIALTLRLLGGLTTEEIERAFLVQEVTVAQRIVRAKRTLSEKRVPFEAPRSRYKLEAALAACHARAHTAEETDWARITDLYAELGRLRPSPIVEFNRAVAVGIAHGPLAGPEIVDKPAGEPSLRHYHLLPSVRGDLLFKLARYAEAHAEFERAPLHSLRTSASGAYYWSGQTRLRIRQNDISHGRIRSWHMIKPVHLVHLVIQRAPHNQPHHQLDALRPAFAHVLNVRYVRQALRVVREPVKELLVPFFVDQAAAFTMDLVRHAAGPEDHHAHVLVVLLDGFADGAAEREAALPAGRRIR